MSIDLSKLPEQFQVMVDEYLSPANHRTNKDVVVLSLLSRLSRFACFCKVNIKNENLDVDTSPNVFCINFARSGEGKDKSLRSIQKVSGFFEEYEEEVFNIYKLQAEDKIEKEAKSLEGSKAVKTKYISDHRPRHITTSMMSNGTSEGLASLRESMQDADIGCVHWQNSEFLAFCAKEKNNEFLTSVYEIFDNGDSNPKIIKGEKTAKRVTGVYQTMFVHSSIGDEKTIKPLKHFFDVGYARRSLVCYPESTIYPPMTLLERKAIARRAVEGEEVCRTFLSEFFNRIRSVYDVIDGVPYYVKRNVTITEEAEDFFFEYEEEMFQKAQRMTSDASKGLIAEMTARHWRAIKIAALFAIQQQEGDFKITIKEAEQAKYLVDYFGEHFRTFYGLKSSNEVEKIIDFIAENQDKQVIGKTLIRKQDLHPTYCDFTKWFDSTIKEVEEALDVDGKVLDKSKFGRNSIGYRIKNRPVHTEALTDDIKIDYSLGKTKGNAVVNFTPESCKFSDLHKVVTKGTCYWGGHYENNYRKESNAKILSMMVLDFDNDCEEKDQLTFNDAKIKFKDFKALLVTTKSHNTLKTSEGGAVKKEKGVRDRFRVIIPLINFPEKYINMAENFNRDSGFNGQLDLNAIKGISKHYQSHDGEYFYTEGKNLFNCEVYDYETPKISSASNFKVYPVDKKIGAPQGYKSLTDIRVTDKKIGKDCNWDDYAYLKNDEKISYPVNCYAHEDKNGSGYIGRNKLGTLFFRCQGCGEMAYCERNI